VTLSLVIVTDGARLDNLARTLESVKDLTQETIIVYQGTDIPIFKKISEMCSYSVMTTPKGNADPDRNYAYGLATGDWILALDDDEYPTDDAKKLISRVMKSEAEVVWFKFLNLVDGVDIESTLGEDPHPRMWRRKANVIVWPDRAHTFPQINTPLQYFTSQKIVHDRKFDELNERHLKRVPSMDPQMIQLEKNFINALKQKLGKK
jgi:glycosyltransferase involved in cell wall biosynthesis